MIRPYLGSLLLRSRSNQNIVFDSIINTCRTCAGTAVDKSGGKNSGDQCEIDLPEPLLLRHERYDTNTTDPRKTPIVVYHGLFGSKTNWRTLSKVMTQKTDRIVYTLDVRNHGGSPQSAEMNYAAMISDVNYFMTNRKLNKIITVGHSLGGRAFIQMALTLPEKVEKLVVVDIGVTRVPGVKEVLINYVKSMKEATKLLTNIENISDARRAVDEFVRPMIGDPFIRGFLLTNLIVDDKNKTIRWAFNLDAIEHMLTSEFHEIAPKNQYNGPVLLVHGGESAFVNDKAIEDMRKLFPKLEVNCIPGGSHYLHVEKPNEFLDVLIKFVNS